MKRLFTSHALIGGDFLVRSFPNDLMAEFYWSFSRLRTIAPFFSKTVQFKVYPPLNLGEHRVRAFRGLDFDRKVSLRFAGCWQTRKSLSKGI